MEEIEDPDQAPAAAAHALGPGLEGPVEEGEIGQGFSFFVIKNNCYCCV